MALNSLYFAASFLIFLLVLLVIPKRLRKIWLLAGNTVFYLSWERWSALLLLLSALMVWLCGLGAGKARNDSGKKSLTYSLLVILPILWNLGLLFFFRYTGLIGDLFNRAGIPFTARDIIPPLGILFYTLRCISYMVEVRTGKIQPVRDPLDVLIYISFFPQIISGPIERPSKFFSELSEFQKKKLWNTKKIREGFLLYLWGLFLKIVLAERLTTISVHIFSDFSSRGFWELLIACIAYMLQIYCDFGGYSDMSRGISNMIGFGSVRNFFQPYLGVSIKNYWRRWHISLTSLLRDYVYFPLGGSRKGLLRKYINIIIVFLLSAIWHGNTLNFVFWGLLQAFLQIIEDLWEKTGIKLPNWLMWIFTFIAINISLIFFNSGGLNRGFRIFRQLFTNFAFPTVWDLGMIPGNLVVLLAGLLILAIVDILHEKGVSIYQKTAALPLPLRWLLYLGLIWSVIMFGIYGVGYDTSGFIYAQF